MVEYPSYGSSGEDPALNSAALTALLCLQSLSDAQHQGEDWRLCFAREKSTASTDLAFLNMGIITRSVCRKPAKN